MGSNPNPPVGTLDPHKTNHPEYPGVQAVGIINPAEISTSG